MGYINIYEFSTAEIRYDVEMYPVNGCWVEQMSRWIVLRRLAVSENATQLHNPLILFIDSSFSN